MLFDGCSRENQKRGLARERVDLLPIQIGEVSRVRDPGFHFVVAPAVADSEWNVAILPGLSNPLGS